MTDCFELLGLARSTRLDSDEIQQRYRDLARETHPDVASNEEERAAFSERTSQLNLARETLSDPVRRLRHLLELQAPGEKPDAGLNEALMGHFATVGEVLQQADAHLARKRAASSALAKALLAGEDFRLQSRLQTVLGSLNQAREELNAEAVAVDDLPAIRKLYTSTSFLNRWEAQLNERILAFLTTD